MLTFWAVVAPWMLVQYFKWLTPLFAAVLTFSFWGLNEVAIELEEPFGCDDNDLDIDKLSESILGDCRHLLNMRRKGAGFGRFSVDSPATRPHMMTMQPRNRLGVALKAAATGVPKLHDLGGLNSLLASELPPPGTPNGQGGLTDRSANSAATAPATTTPVTAPATTTPVTAPAATATTSERPKVAKKASSKSLARSATPASATRTATPASSAAKPAKKAGAKKAPAAAADSGGGAAGGEIVISCVG